MLEDDFGEIKAASGKGVGGAPRCCANAAVPLRAGVCRIRRRRRQIEFYRSKLCAPCQSLRTTSPAASGCARAADWPAHACIRSMSLALIAASRMAWVRAAARDRAPAAVPWAPRPRGRRRSRCCGPAGRKTRGSPWCPRDACGRWRRPGARHLGFGAAQEAGADLHRGSAQQQSRGDAARVGDSAGGDHREPSPHRPRRAAGRTGPTSRPPRGRIKGAAVPAGLHALGDDGIGAGVLRLPAPRRRWWPSRTT